MWVTGTSFKNDGQDPCQSLGRMLFVFLHDLVGPSQQNGRPQKGHVDENLPLDVLRVLVRDIDERFEQVNA
jgi:hypothetical protein